MDYNAIFSALPEPQAGFERCFAFSVHKNGSSLLEKMIQMVCNRAKIPAVSVPSLMFREGILDTDWMNDLDSLPAFERQLLYYGFRFLPAALKDPAIKLRESRFILLVRDPRDALVSQYFSYGRKSGSHAVPAKNKEAFLAALAQKSDEVTIDQYVLQAANNLRLKLEAYRTELNFDKGLVCRYEDIYFDKETFLREIFGHFGITVPDQILRKVAQANDIRPEKEDDSKHIRKGTPGDHKEKLKPETIAKLNDTFRDVGGFFGYTL